MLFRSILMTARLREEMLAGKPVRVAVAEAVRHVAPAVAAAGLVLASSFGTLMLESSEVARQQGFAMAFGILLASLVVSSILVPALTALAGARAWWPGRSARQRARTERPKELAPHPSTYARRSAGAREGCRIRGAPRPHYAERKTCASFASARSRDSCC